MFGSVKRMEEIYAACVTYEPSIMEYVDFSAIAEPVWLLGKKYNVQDGDDFRCLQDDIRSKLWFTYRKQFPPIGDTYFISDSGWGCMHRCGQMLMAQALILKHLGRDWTWSPNIEDSTYFKILSQFNDKEECQYSMHRIAKEGLNLDKEIGQWFGPNTIVQVLRRIAEGDAVNNLTVHVAMDNMVIKNEIRSLFRRGKTKKKSEVGHQDNSRNLYPKLDNDKLAPPENMGNSSRPILLTIPLRLGLSEIMPVYFEKLKASFMLKQSLGIVGGRTNHASYFIGYVGNELIFLDPHTTQLHRSEEELEDSSYHCDHPSRMAFDRLDPSIALCFYCEDEDDFEEWCAKVQHSILEPEKDAIFEILEDKPAMLPYVDIEDLDEADLNISLTDADRKYTSDDEFELIS